MQRPADRRYRQRPKVSLLTADAGNVAIIDDLVGKERLD
jgi:hypothetical protein